ncbi:MAG: aconitate hydratase [Pseudomonadota bacterium]
MGQNIVQKVLSSHLKEGQLNPGQEIGIKIDQTLTQDATGTMAYLQFESLKADRVKTDLSVSYVDHNTVQVGFENADDHAYLQSIAARYGIIFSRPGNGICHQVHLERFGKPGTTLLGSDSHTPTGGGVGQIAIGAGGLDVAVAMGGGLFYLSAPKVYKVNLIGALKPWVTAKDVILKMLEMLSTKGNVGVMLEYAGPGVKTLTVPERATITNMGAEMGVTASIFPADEETKKFLIAQGRADDWLELKADEDAQYEKVIELDLSTIEPLAAAPHSPGNIVKITELSGKKVDQVCVGSCTNSSYQDLVTVAMILKGKTVHPDVSLAIAPGSRQVLSMLAKEGHLADLISAGARIMESTCGFCIGNSLSPKSGAVSIRTVNRNFEGRSGTKDANVYLTSCEVAAASALSGEFTDPRTLGDYPKIAMPERYNIDDSMFIFPTAEMKNTEIKRGPNIGAPPSNQELPEKLVGEVMIKVGDKITTDHIMPAGPRLKFRSNVPKYANYVFEHIDATFAERCLANKEKGKHNFIVAGESYGQGSSREHAALCPMYLGVKAVLAKSFERIHTDNLVNFGIIPLIFTNAQDYEAINNGDKIEIANIRMAIESSKPIKVTVGNKTIECQTSLSERQKKMILAGGLLNYTTTI